MSFCPNRPWTYPWPSIIPCIILLALCTLRSMAAHAEIRFEEVTLEAGIWYRGPSWGAAWGDANTDGWPDLYVSNHGARATLYYNNQDGTFSKALDPAFSYTGDRHGAAWADFDNDGDADLIELGGSAGENSTHPNMLILNDGAFIERAAALGLSYPAARGRTPLWWDWDRDGNPDLLVTTIVRSDGTAPSLLFLSTGDTFFPIDPFPDYGIARNLWTAHASDLDDDGTSELFTLGWPLGLRILDTSTLPFSDITDSIGIGLVRMVKDFLIGDFNSDLRADLFVSRAAEPGSEWALRSANELDFQIVPTNDVRGLDIASEGSINLSLSPSGSWPRSQVFVGHTGYHPATWSFRIDSTDPLSFGFSDPSLDEPGVYIGYDPSASIWNIRITGRGFATTLKADAPITRVEPTGFNHQTPIAAPDHLFIGGLGKFQDESAASGFSEATSCHSAATGDLDNDMDLDIYLVCSSAISNLPNLIFENVGNGQFVRVSKAGGAQGTTEGRGDVAVLADYNFDGSLDLFLTNGHRGPPFNDGPHQLFRNVGNGNHWLQIDLRGRASNRDGLGARVSVYAGGKWQVREQAAGMHNRAQDFTRIHFGLGPYATAERVAVTWPSGAVQRQYDIQADQVIRIAEPFFCGLGAEIALILLPFTLLMHWRKASAQRRQRGIGSSIR